MTARIADAGFIIALNSLEADERAWARGEMKKWQAPFLTCEGALVEASHLCPPAAVARMLEDKSFMIDFDLPKQIAAVRLILEKYKDQPMDFVDACIVRMSELIPDCVVYTVDRDFEVYRRFGDKRIPVVYPPED